MSINISQIINPQSLSFSSIKEDIFKYLQSRPDYEAWRDFYKGGAGTTQVELIAGLASYLAFHSIGARRESFIDQRKLYSSAINIASTLGYPVNRVSAPRYYISFFTPRSFYLDRNIPLATYKDFALTPLFSRTVNQGYNRVRCVLGEWDSFSYTANSDANFQILQVMADNIDNNRFADVPLEAPLGPDDIDISLEVLINGVQHKVVTYAEELLNEAILIKTYLDGILLVFGDGTLGYKVRNNDDIVFNYIKATAPQDFLTLDVGSLSSSYDITFTGFENYDPGSNMDSIEKLAVLPSGYFASKRRMLTGDDHVAILMSYQGDIISAGYNRLEGGCCTVSLSYLFQDEHIVSDTEKETIMTYLDEYKVVGVRLELKNPHKYGIALSYVVVIEEGTDITLLQQSLEEIVKGYTMKLGQSFHAGAVTAEFSKLDGVARVYVKYPVSDREFDYDQYLGFINYEIVFTTNKNFVEVLDPENTGYYKRITWGKTTSASPFKIECSTAKFISGDEGDDVLNLPVEQGDLVVMPGSLSDKAYVVSVDSETELTLDSDMFSEEGMAFEIYRPVLL